MTMQQTLKPAAIAATILKLTLVAPTVYYARLSYKKSSMDLLLDIERDIRRPVQNFVNTTRKRLKKGDQIFFIHELTRFFYEAAEDDTANLPFRMSVMEEPERDGPEYLTKKGTYPAHLQHQLGQTWSCTTMPEPIAAMGPQTLPKAQTSIHWMDVYEDDRLGDLSYNIARLKSANTAMDHKSVICNRGSFIQVGNITILHEEALNRARLYIGIMDQQPDGKAVLLRLRPSVKA